MQTQKWDFFLTITFKDPLPRHRVESATNAVAKSIRAFNPDSRIFLGAEAHYSRFMHLHGLYRGHRHHAPILGEQTALFWLLKDIYGRSRVEAVKSLDKVSSYCVKYCTKDMSYYLLW